MVNLAATGAAVFAVCLFGVGLVALTGSSFGPAGVAFLSASIVIYLRETHLVED